MNLRSIKARAYYPKPKRAHVPASHWGYFYPEQPVYYTPTRRTT